MSFYTFVTINLQLRIQNTGVLIIVCVCKSKDSAFQIRAVCKFQLTNTNINMTSSHIQINNLSLPSYNISVSGLRYSANHNALDIWPIRACLASQNDELCKNQRVSERRGIEEQQ